MGGQILDYETKDILNRGIKIGIEQGIAQGIADRDTQKISEMLTNGKTPKAISEFCGYPLEQVMAVANKQKG